MTRSLPHAFVGFILAALTALSAPEPLRAATVFEDHDLSTWTFLSDPGDPGIQLVHLPYGNPYLFVRQRHIAGGYSRKQSDQGAPAAVYRPQSSGAVAGFTFSGRFRPHFEGEPLAAYASTALQVFPLLRQAGRVYIAESPLYQWNAALPLGLWTTLTSIDLTPARFLRDGLTSERPDFSASAAPIELGLRVVTAYQRGAIEPTEHTFEVDVDDFRVESRPQGGGNALEISFESTGSSLPTERGPIPFSHVPAELDATAAVAKLRLSQVATSTVRFATQFVGDVISDPGSLSAGQSGTGILFSLPRQDFATVLELISADGAVVGEPRALAFLVHDATYTCSFSAWASWREDLRLQGYGIVAEEPTALSAQTMAPVGARTAEAASGGLRSAADDIATLQALRDEVMATTAAGRYYTALYGTLSPAIIGAMVTTPALLVDLASSADPWIDALGTLVSGNGSARVTSDMAADLNRLLDRFEAGGSPSLRRTLARERARLGLDSIGGLTLAQFWQRVNARWDAESCSADSDGLCLGEGGRYRVEADWKSPAGGAGRGRAVALSGDSGYFWFFDPANVELLTKVVDGCGLNQRIWSYSAGLTNLEVELFVFDTATGRGRTYRNPQATNFAPILDSSYLECETESLTEAAAPPPVVPSSVELLGGAGCTPGPSTLCLDGGRFRVEADYRTAAGASGPAHAVPLTDDTGTFWFFTASNIELVVKTIDACGLSGFENYWVFAGGTTDVEVTLRVTDTLHDVAKVYRRPLGVPFAPVLDSGAFATCP